MGVDLEASEEVSHSYEYVNECVLASGNILNRLRDWGVKIVRDEKSRYSPGGGRRRQRRLLSRVRIPIKIGSECSPRTSLAELPATYQAHTLAESGRKRI
jgi:hypothetical protein